MRDLYVLDPEWTHLNHGSFGACPRPVLDEYQRLQRELERGPTEFFRGVPDRIAAARAELAEFVGADPEGLLFMQNVTLGVNAVAQSLRLGPGDEVLATDHEYGSNNLLWQYLADRDGFEFVRRPFDSPDDFWAGVNERTRVLFVSHIASETASRFPVEDLCTRAREARIVSIVDGAHAPGHLDLDLATVGADVYAGNCHKWLSAPKGSGFLHVAEAHRDRLEPHVIGWGWADDAAFRRPPPGPGHARSVRFSERPRRDRLPARARLAGRARPLPRTPAGERGAARPRAHRPGLRPDGRARAAGVRPGRAVAPPA
ncbi:MAG: aminotransferase class V-fold PLP-dependent enzyme, partial [Thermoleophilia bacterium]